MSSNDLCKACALLQGLESGLPSALRSSQLGGTEVPEGQRSIPKYERKLRVAEGPAATEGIERAVKRVEIKAE